MDTLKCKLSPLVFAELYHLLAASRELAERLTDRLADLDYGYSLLSDAAEAYEAKWQADLEYLSPDTADDFALAPEHALFATWILAGLRNRGSCFELSTQLSGSVWNRAIDGMPTLAPSRPPSLNPAIMGWTLGAVAGQLDASLPVVPAAYPADEHVTAAYCGLVEHVLHLAKAGNPLPEMVSTATFVRGAGLAEALKPLGDGPQRAIDRLMVETRRLLPEEIWERLRKNWIGWVDRRNALTHVATAPGTPTFTEAVAMARSWNQIELTVMGITHFVFQEVSRELYEAFPPALRTDAWGTYLQREIQTVW